MAQRSVESSGGGSECSENNGGYDSRSQRKPYHRHTPAQIQRLEGFYKTCAHPDDKQRRQLGMELGLEPRQIKFWFQNKRTQTKAQNERSDNNALRNENDRIRNENIAIGEALKNLTCGSCGPCGGAHIKEEEKNRIQQKLEQENVALKHEYDKVSSVLAKYMGKPLPGPIQHTSDSDNASEASVNPKKLGSDQMKANPELEKLLMTEIAASAMDELIMLLRVDQPLWVKSPTEEHYVLDLDCYNKIMSKPTLFKYANSRMESSKDSGVVAMGARLLVDIFLDPDKLVDFFPTVFSETKSISVIKSGLLENRSDSLQLIHEQMHIVSPLLQDRDFYLLRYCQQIETGTWVIVDVSYNCFGGSHDLPTCCWKYPSGCMIEEMPNGLSKVTCVERVEVDYNVMDHSIYEDLVKSTLGFGARRWIMTLQRTMERYTFLKEAGSLNDRLGRGRRCMIKLASKMIKSYCSIFRSFGTDHFHRLSELRNNQVQFAVHQNTHADLPVGIIIRAASSFWVPASTKRVFNYLNDCSMRPQWDVLCNGSQVSEVMHIPSGPYSSNFISILRPLNHHEGYTIFQESAMGQLESFIIYAPFDSSSMLELATGVTASHAPFLASGFLITPAAPEEKAAASTSTIKPQSGGSVITMAFQILGCTSLSSENMSLEKIATADAFIGRAIRVLKTTFDCSD